MILIWKIKVVNFHENLYIIPAATDIRPRVKRQTEETSTNGPGAEGEAEGEAPKKEGGVSLGKILGLVFLVCCILYCVGISWKVSFSHWTALLSHGICHENQSLCFSKKHFIAPRWTDSVHWKFMLWEALIF